MNIYAQDGKVVIDPHGQLWLTPFEAFELASKLMETARYAREQKRDAGKAREDPSDRK